MDGRTTEEWIDRWTDRCIDGWTDEQMGGRTDRETEGHSGLHIYILLVLYYQFFRKFLSIRCTHVYSATDGNVVLPAVTTADDLQ